MLAALIATRPPPTPPPPPMYGNQLVAATTTFLCLTLAKQAALLSSNLSYSYQLLLSTSGNPSIVSQLELYYHRLVNQYSSNANGYALDGSLMNPIYLSTQIAAVIGVATTLNTLIQTLPVAPNDVGKLVNIQTRMSVALRILLSLSIPITLNFT